MRTRPCRQAFAAAVLVAACAVPVLPAQAITQVPVRTALQQDTAQVEVTLQVRSTVPGQEIRFKAAYRVDDQAGLQYVERTTPFEATGRTRNGAIAILDRVSGEPELYATLVRGSGTDTLRVSEASGPRLVVQYDPRATWAHGQFGPSKAFLGRFCVPRSDRGFAYLRDLVRQYHPEALAPAAQQDSLIVGFVFDNGCRVLHHAIGRTRPEDRTVDDELARLFPDLSPVGAVASGGASTQPFAKGGLLIVWREMER